MNKKIFSLIVILSLSVLTLIPFASASQVYITQNSMVYSPNNYGQFFDFSSNTVNASQVFKADATAYLNYIGATVKGRNVDTGPGVNHDPDAWFIAGIYNVDATNKPNLTSPVELSTSRIRVQGLSGYQALYFEFSGDIQLTNGTLYAFVISADYKDFVANYDDFMLAASEGGLGDTGEIMYGYASGTTWSATSFSPDATGFLVMGSSTPQTTPTATPGGTNWIDDTYGSSNSGITWLNTTLPFFVPLVLIMICGFLGWYFARAWGFFAGFNLGVVLAYVIFPLYMPLWGVLAVIVVDGLLIYGKVGMNRGE